MELKVNDLSLTEKEVEVTFTYDEVKTDIETEVRKQTKNIQLSGFRKGKVPLSLLKKMYGDALETEASEKVANNQFWEIAKEKHLHPIGQPSLTEIKLNPGADLFFKVKYEVMPQLEVKDYTDLEIEIPNYEITDDDVESEIKYILKANRTTETGEVVDSDQYIIDVEVSRVDDEGKPFPNSKPESLQIDLTNEQVQKEIVENSKGKKAGDTFSFTFTDERAAKNEKGEEEKIKEVYNYNALIKDIKKIIAPELNEELIKKVTKDKVNTEADLRSEIRTDIQKYYDQRNDEMIQEKLISSIIKNNDFTPPSTLVTNVLEDMVKNEVEAAKKEGYKNIDKNETSNRLRKSAEYNVKWFLIKDAIQKKENITITDEELNELATKDAEKTGIAVDKLINYYKSSNYGEKVVDKKLLDFLKEKNIIKKVEPNKLLQNETKETK